MATESKAKRDKNRILLVIRWPVGGIRTFIRYVYNNFDRSEYSITILAPDIPEIKVLQEDLKDFDVYLIPFKNDLSTMGLIKLITKKIMFGHFDLIHSQGFTAAICTALPARLSGTKHIMTSHDVLLSKQFTGLKGFLKKKVLSLLLPMIDIIHSVGNDAQDNLFEFVPSLKKRAQKCVVILNGIETQRFIGTEKRDFRKELNLTDDTFLIGFLGRFMSQKGFIYLVEALELLIKKELHRRPVILTFGDGGFIREEMRNIIEKGIEKFFIFLPFEANIASVLKGLDVIVIPSLWEAYPLLPMEAMVAGVPVIGTDCIGLREALIGTPARMVKTGDANDLAKAILEEMNNPSKVKAEAFREEAAIRFDVRKQAFHLEKVIQSLLV